MKDVGKILILPKDKFVGGSSYDILDSVTLDGKAYLSKINNNTHTPSGETDNYWFLYAQDGFTPTIESSKVDGVVTLIITNATGSETIRIVDGKDGESVVIASATKTDGVTTVVLEDKNGQQTLVINDGKDGVGIANFDKKSDGLTDVYTITYTDNTTSTITITNGRGIVRTEKTSSTVDVTGRVIDTYTQVFNDGSTFAYTITNGKDGTGTGDMEKAVYDKDNDGKVDAAETADSVDWTNVENRPFTAVGSTLEVTNIETTDPDTGDTTITPTLNAKVMTGANSQSDGVSGLVPKPESGDVEKFLGGNGKWRAVSQMTGASASADGQAGMVPTPLKGDENKFLRGDGAWVENATMSGATSSKAGTKGLVPAPAAGDNEKFFRGDGTWAEADSLGTKVTANVSGDSVAFVNADIGDTSVIDGPYIKDSLVGLDEYTYDSATHTLTFTLTDDSADGKAAIIYVRN